MHTPGEKARITPIQNAMDWIKQNHGAEYLVQFQDLPQDELAHELLGYLQTCYEDQYIDTHLVYAAPRLGDNPELDKVTGELEEAIAKVT
jgi:hypothetical protein